MLSIVSLNARGLRNNNKRKALFLFAKQFKSDLFYLQESHSTVENTNLWRSQWGNTILRILITECDPEGHFICQVVEYNFNIM